MPFAIGIEHTKTEHNVGTLLRSALNFGASMVFTVDCRVYRRSSDTLHTARHIPVLHFLTWADAWAAWPPDWVPVAVEIREGAVSLAKFSHPRSAVYVLGPEDGSVSREFLDRAKHTLVIPTGRTLAPGSKGNRFAHPHDCLNVAAAGTVVMYDRVAKEVP